MLRLASNNLFASSKKIRKSQNSLVRCFENDDISGFICKFGVVLAFGGYDTYALTAINPANYECYIRDTLAAFLCGTYQINVSKEVFGSLGRADIVAKLNTIDLAKVYVFELKMLKEKSTPEDTLLEAKEQILTRKYVEQHFFTTDIVTAVSIVLDKETRNIVLYDVMQLEKKQMLASEKFIDVSDIDDIKTI
ncbi:MAG: PD-(D/E)XK nuclease domain-containing protein [Desulfovibrio sp.]|jgi:hypothetical protein|nr:PD-(D/E)XK nuclease domain-containing protein [Desulfovibrio sp.]